MVWNKLEDSHLWYSTTYLEGKLGLIPNGSTFIDRWCNGNTFGSGPKI